MDKLPLDVLACIALILESAADFRSFVSTCGRIGRWSLQDAIQETMKKKFCHRLICNSTSPPDLFGITYPFSSPDVTIPVLPNGWCHGVAEATLMDQNGNVIKSLVKFKNNRKTQTQNWRGDVLLMATEELTDGTREVIGRNQGAELLARFTLDYNGRRI
jgi:hypothetical protein